jgi:AcrR family transcriptional regulator
MSARDDILTAAAELLVESTTGEVSTRAICERAGVQAPTLYRHFGDKDALLAAVVDEAFEQYLGSKRLVVATDDPVERLRNGWDSHNAWGRAHPAYYRIIFSPAAVGAAASVAAEAAMGILRSHLDACAEAGLLRVPPRIAAQMVMAANVGVTLMQITRPGLYPDPELSMRVRDSVHAQILLPQETGATATAGATARADVAATATTLAALLRADDAAPLTPSERSLLLDWLTRLA